MKRMTGFLFLAVFALAGCGGGNGSGTPASTAPPPTPPPPLAANFQSIQDNVFTPRCIGCHIGASAPQGLRLDDANSFGLLVGVTSGQAAPLLRVDPGDPDNSYLIQKLEGTAGMGGQMPLNSTPLPQADIDVIRQWITDGALPPVGNPPTSPIRVTSLSPLPDSAFDTLPASVIAMFDRELDATSVDATTFILERSGGDGDFTDGDEVMVAAAAITVSMASPMTATFDLTGVASEIDTYRVRLLGTGGATIRDLGANALDGEFSGAFPSGDSTQGGDFESLFTVSAVVATLDSIQANIFTPTCTVGCHSGPMPSAGQDLSDADASFNALVMVPSNQSALLKVMPGDPDASYLIEKLEEDMPAGGLRMPRNGPPYLDQAVIDVVRQWITDGANR